MKKTLFAVLALAAVAACNKAEVVEQNPANAIAFDNVFVDNATKSVNDPSYTNTNLFSDFAVFGFVEDATLFDGVQVSKTITNGELESAWKYAATQYWIAGATYNFSAVAPMTNGNWSNATASAEGVSFEFTNDGKTDVLYAQTLPIEGAASNNADVAFTFRHILSKVKLSFENGYNASSATLRVENVKIENAFATGKAELKGETTTWGTHAGVLELAFGMATDNEATADVKENAEVAYAYGKTYETQNELFLIPGAVPSKEVTVDETTTTVPGYYVSFDVVLLVSGKPIDTYHHTASVNFTPEAGKCYDIKATVTASNIDPDHAQEPIEFTVTTLNDWTAANPNPAI